MEPHSFSCFDGVHATTSRTLIIVVVCQRDERTACVCVCACVHASPGFFQRLAVEPVPARSSDCHPRSVYLCFRGLSSWFGTAVGLFGLRYLVLG